MCLVTQDVHNFISMYRLQYCKFIKIQAVFILFILITFSSSCLRRVCPAYTSYFIVHSDQQKYYLNPFEGDTLPKDYSLFASTSQNIFGIRKKRRPLPSIFLPKKYPLANYNYPKVVKTKITFSFNTDSTAIQIDSLAQELPDSLLVDLPDIGESDDPTDTTTVAAFSVPNIKPGYPEKNIDQIFYELLFPLDSATLGLDEPQDSLAADSTQVKKRGFVRLKEIWTKFKKLFISKSQRHIQDSLKIIEKESKNKSPEENLYDSLMNGFIEENF